MANTDADKEAEGKEAPAPKSPGHTKLVIVGAVALFVALVGAQVAVPLINKALDGSADTAVATDEEHADEAEEAVAESEEEEAEPEHVEPALYVPLDPPFVVSFDAEDGARYLQLTLQAMARSEETIGEIKRHAPAIRNSFLFLLSSYKLEELSTLEGKEKLRGEMLVAANEVMAKNGSEPGIEELYFTSLVIQ
jgi:flagellar protein FliL